MTILPVIRRLAADEIGQKVEELSDLLIDCVEGGASVGFMHPLAREKARAFWLAIGARAAAGAHELLAVEIGDFFAGSVQLVGAQYENQPHRADVSKLLVHRRARRRGLGRALMEATEDLAREAGKTVLVLDTAGDEARRLYDRLNWTIVGRVPDYALWPDGRLCDTTIMFKRVETRD
ncbi:MAG TPA: GNAT family N-acetyltransferase [Roseiarcus sp.]|nr:GNAT family N-acetyltransferase [Roseiarcus sp.]